MKKCIAFMLALLCVLGIVGCEGKSGKDVSDEARVIVEIRDRTKEEELVCSDTIEVFYEDENTKYQFSQIKSHYIVVTYNNGNSEDIVTALKAGRATIADLDKFGIKYYTKPKNE